MDRQAAHWLSFAAITVLLLVAFAIGGGGSRFALANLAVQLTAFAVLALHQGSFFRFWREGPFTLRAAIAAALFVPLIQIIPLPEPIWSALPGRELVSRSLELAGTGGWMPISLDPRRTALALTALITPMAVLTAGWMLPRDRVLLIGWVVILLGLLTAIIGVVQIGATDDANTMFGARRPGELLLGTFANRNSTGLFLVFALALAAVLPAPRPYPAALYMRLGLCALLLISIVLTRSRSALVLALLPVGLGCLRGLWWAVRERGGSASARLSGGGMLAIALAAVALAGTAAATLVIAAPGPLRETLQRFEAKDDPRRFIWDDAAYSAARYWPAGAGMGSFDEIFQVDESLENLTKRRAGRAHNDYLELAIEAGPAGLGVAGLWLLVIGWLSWRARHASQRWTAWAGSTFLIAIALQSITDYPLRNQTMLAFAGLALLFLARIAHDAKAKVQR